MLLAHLYQGPDMPPRPASADAGTLFPWILQQIRQAKTIAISRLEDLPAEAARDREALRVYGTHSVLIVPLVTAGSVFGILTFASNREREGWPEGLVKRLQLIAEVFAHAIARARGDKALRESEARYRDIFEGAIEGIYRTSLEGKLITANPALATILGYDSAEDALRTITDSAHQIWADPDERSRLAQLLQDRGFVRAYECQFLRKDGTKLWVSQNVRAVQGPDGKWAYFEGFIQDITERKRLELEIRQSYEEVQLLRDRLQIENVYLREQIQRDGEHGAILGNSKPILMMLAKAKQVAPTDSAVLIIGETGTGKELLAQAIHDMSRRGAKPMAKVNCAALPPALVEAELFGREKGAYTGALSRQAGRFEVADGSTLFLDEVGDLPLELQAKLLRVVQFGEFERLGSTRTLKVNVRVIAATNRDLAKAVEDGHFRQDFYYRLNVFPLTVPPLRERPDDIPALVWSIVQELGQRMGKRIEAIPRRVMERLQVFHWPGNVRQLRNVIEHALILSTGPTLDIDFPNDADARPITSSGQSLEEVERQHIRAVLEGTRWRIRGSSGAAAILGVPESTLRSRMKKLGISRPS
jgi:PAS domain S-box-containing protein